MLTSSYASIQSLSRSLMNASGQVTQSLQYTSFTDGQGGTLAYSAARGFGARERTIRFSKPIIYYDMLGRLYATHDSSGTETQTFYDATGKVTETWVGTDDVPDQTYFTRAGGDPSPGPDPRDFHAWVMQNPTATSGPAGTSMYLVSMYQYDLDGDVIESDSQFDSGSTDFYATHFQYDSRDRATGVLSPGNVLTRYEYDNLGRVTSTETYASADFDR